MPKTPIMATVSMLPFEPTPILKFRTPLVLAWVTLLSGCAVFGPPGPSAKVAAPVAQPGPASFAPDSWSMVADRQGLSPLELTESGTVPDDWADLMPDDEGSGIEDALTADGTVPPILAMDVAAYDIPQSDDPRVRQWIDFLTGRGRESFERWLSRSTRYVPIFLPILEEYGLPKDLVYLSMIESGFSPRAFSWARASGLWQFMPATGQRYGLDIDFWIDERRDFEKATHAAAKYLSTLHGKFGHWYLAFAAYNAGPGRVSRAIRRTRSKDFFRISRTRRLKRETKHYVPKMLAAAQIAKQPASYGFENVRYLPPLRWDTITVELATDLETVATACGLADAERGVELVELLNPELRCKVTPPGQRYTLRVPEGRADRCATGLAAMSPRQRYTYRYHEVTDRDTLDRLAKLYSTTSTAIASFNKIEDGRLDQYEEIVVPVKVADAATIRIVRPPKRAFRPSVYGPLKDRVIVHRVRRGESLWKIAQRYRVSIRQLRMWNGLWRTNTLRVGQRIKIHGGRVRRASAPRGTRTTANRHRVRSGESLWLIAVRYGTSVERLCKLNRIKRDDKLQIGRVLRIR